MRVYFAYSRSSKVRINFPIITLQSIPSIRQHEVRETKFKTRVGQMLVLTKIKKYTNTSDPCTTRLVTTHHSKITSEKAPMRYSVVSVLRRIGISCLAYKSSTTLRCYRTAFCLTAFRKTSNCGIGAELFQPRGHISQSRHLTPAAVRKLRALRGILARGLYRASRRASRTCSLPDGTEQAPYAA